MTKFILAIFMAVISILAPFNNVKAPEEEKVDFKPVIRFSAVSDSHVEMLGDKRTQRIQKAISLAYNVAAQDENYPTLDGMIYAGDLTDDGRRLQFLDFIATTNKALKDETQLMAVVAKSHDGYVFKGGTGEYFEGISGLNADSHYVINGFHFIGISRSKNDDEHYSEYQREWLKAQLDEATKDDPEKPIFVFHHEHVADTVYGSLAEDGWGIDYFKDIIEEYPQIVHLSGHSHYPLNDPRSIWQGKFTAIGTGSLNYAEFTVDGVNVIHPDNYRKMGQEWIIEVDAENTIRLRGYDVLSGTLLCEYYINNPADASHRQFTPAQQEAALGAPAFKDGAELKVKKIAGKYKVTAPAAESEKMNPVFLYRFYVYNENGEEVSSKWVLNNYWLADTYESITEKVKAEKGCTIKVVAENAYGKQSEALEYKV